MKGKINKYIYVAEFEADTEYGGYTVTFPDIPGCITEGDDLEETMRNAKEALELHLFSMEEDNDLIPEPTLIEKIEKEEGSILVPIQVYMKPVRENLNSKATSKNVTLPYWLKKLAEQEKINFSETLQFALKEKLQINFLDNINKVSNSGKLLKNDNKIDYDELIKLKEKIDRILEERK